MLVEDSEHPYLSDDARITLQGYRDDFRELLRRAGHAIQHDDGAARWWTFAGGRINHTLKYALAETTGWKVVSDNWHLRIEGDGVTHGSLEEAILAISVPAFWEDLDVWQRIIAKVPPYRLSKFQPALPPRFAQEMLGRYLLDVDATRRFLLGDEARHLEGLVDLLRQALARGAPLEEPELPALPAVATPKNAIRFVDTQAGLEAVCRALLTEERVGLDVETTLVGHDLCTIQISTPTVNVVIDARAIDDLTPIAQLLESGIVLKVIHNASFELSVFQKLSIDIVNVFDTLTTSRRLRGRQLDGGHGLRAVCERELGKTLDKAEQTSDWTRRPLTPRQLLYAAMDVEVLLPLHERFMAEMLL